MNTFFLHKWIFGNFTIRKHALKCEIDGLTWFVRIVMHKTFTTQTISALKCSFLIIMEFKVSKSLMVATGILKMLLNFLLFIAKTLCLVAFLKSFINGFSFAALSFLSFFSILNVTLELIHTYMKYLNTAYIITICFKIGRTS